MQTYDSLVRHSYIMTVEYKAICSCWGGGRAYLIDFVHFNFYALVVRVEMVMAG